MRFHLFLCQMHFAGLIILLTTSAAFKLNSVCETMLLKRGLRSLRLRASMNNDKLSETISTVKTKIRPLSTVGGTLNERQSEAMSRVKGPLAVTAGPGSGKTNMLTSRIASLIIDHKVPSHQVMAVTFTNKAAREMRERVGKLIGVDMKAISSWSKYTEVPEIGTFHSICLRILRQEMIYTPFNSSFSIYDDSDQLKLVKGVLVNLGIKIAKDVEDEEDFEAVYKGTTREVIVDPDRVQKAINNAKCDALQPEDYGIPESAAYDPKIASFALIYQQYQKELFANNALDFGEIICMTYRLLRDNTELREKYQEKFHYIHVDEFQDTNKAQYLWLLMLAGKDYGGKDNICVVGDEDQSVYGWRGAKATNMKNFEKDFPTTHHVKLEQNYRSTQKILNAANHLIKFNVERKDKTLWTENDEGQNIIVAQLEDDKGEAEAVVMEVKRLINFSINQAKLNKGNVRTYADFCILYRTNALSQAFEGILRREKIPYEITKGLRFYDRAEIKDIIAYLSVIINPYDCISIKRIINNPKKKIGPKTIRELEEYYVNIQDNDEIEKLNFLEVIEKASNGEILKFSKATKSNLQIFSTVLKDLRSIQPNVLLSQLLSSLLDTSGYMMKLAEEDTEESATRVNNLSELFNMILDFEKEELYGLTDEESNEKKSQLLGIFLEQCSLSSGADANKEEGDEGAPVHKLKMMTLHSSKGLEFPVVFLVGMEEQIIPSKRNPVLEEERRLCFVGMTRARELLYILFAQRRRQFGQSANHTPSRFLKEIPRSSVEMKIFNVPKNDYQNQYRR
mmetsp:Transcript_34239/g.32634  ORF Transcript_34239/g.32634 Transcript_34239/m.32634 type:complete len:794 (+) Transcript_34239:33-2414(+)